eukprot:m51a1_g10143 putative serine threonine kinase (1409) ;mRNA; r:62958-68430
MGRPICCLLVALLAGSASASVPWTCTATTTKENWEYVQGTVVPSTTTVSSSPDHCRAMCCSVTGCTTNTCTLKSQTLGGAAAPGVTSGVVAKDFGPRNRSLIHYKGCCGDMADRDLPFAVGTGKVLNSQCVELCAAVPSAFAGTQWGGECRCGDLYGRYPALFACDRPCDLNASEICGGWWVNSVFSAGYAVVDKTTCLPVPAFQATAFSVPLGTNTPTLHWQWTVPEWNPFCWGNTFVLAAYAGSVAEYSVTVTGLFTTGPFPVQLKQSSGVALDPGAYNATVTYNSIRAGDFPKSVTTAVCVPSFPAAAALLGPPDAFYDDDDYGTVTFRWAALGVGQWNATVLCGHSFAPTYDVFVGPSPANLSLVARVAGTNYTTHLPSALYYWHVVPNNGARLAFGLADPAHPPRNLTVHIPVCGNGVREGRTERCDGGAGCLGNCTCGAGLYPTSPLSSACEPHCGDGAVAGWEQCDNCTGCTGCRADCLCQAGFWPTSPVSAVCATHCGDGQAAGTEQCDGGEGCANCTCTRGFYARATPGASCETRCGDGVVSGAEDCENTSATCSANCTCRAGYVRASPAGADCVDPCAELSTCRLCLLSAGCGWCAHSSSCVLSSVGETAAGCSAGWTVSTCAADGAQATTGAIAGGVVGGVAGVSVVVSVVLFAFWRKTHHQRTETVVVNAPCTDFLVNAMEIKMISAIGRGSYGVAIADGPLPHRALWKGCEVAAKVLLSDALSEDSVEQFDKEVSVMRSLRHPNVLLFMCYAKNEKELIIVTEFMPKGSMMDLFTDKPPGITLRKRVGMLLDVCKGMSYLHYHEPQIIHCDLKSGNVLLDNNLTAKVCDFGLTVFLDKDTNKSSSKSKDSSIGSLFWTAPEVLAGAPSDVYSFGIIIWEAVTQEVPYVDMNPHYVAQRVMGSQLRPNVTDKFPKPLLALMESCWNFNPLVRPEFPQLVSDWPAMVEEMEPYFKAEEAEQVYVEPPSGLLALVFTGTSRSSPPDIQGSTHLWEWNASVMKKALLRHNDIVRECYRKHSGYEVKTEGDAFMLTFQSPLDALCFCCDAQKALVSEPWDPQLMSQECCAEVMKGETVLYRGLRVRMGIHIGVPEVVSSTTSRSVDYLGPCVNKAARVSSLADILEKFTKQVKHKWSVDPSEVNITNEQLGRGNFGAVYKGEWRGQTVCVKKFFQQKVDKVTLGEVERQLKEIAILTELRHPSIVLFMGACIEPNNMFILSEWMDMGSLRQVLSSQKIEFTLGTQILTSVCQGMIYLHMSGIIHRDLKSSNILLNKKWDVKLADFGLAAVKSTNKTMTVCGTVAWMAPEVLVSSQYSEKSDVFGYGMVMYEVLTRSYPFATTQAMALVPKIVSGQRPPVPADLQGFSAEYVDLMKRCWAPRPEDRPAFKDISAELARMSS